MKNILIIFKKELKDTLRDRRTIFFMIVMPFLIIFLIFNLVFKIGKAQEKKAYEKIITIGLVLNGNAEPFKQYLYKQEKIKIIEKVKEENIEDLIQKKKIDFGLVFEEDFDQKIKDKTSGEVRLYFKTSKENEVTKRRLLKLINHFREELLEVRLKDMELGKSFVKTIKIEEHDIASFKEKFGEYAGGFVPYIFVIFCFLGAMYPAIDLAAGEKERGTIETILASPANRGEIVMGKFFVISLTGFLTAVLSIVWVFLMIRQFKEIPKDILTSIMRIIEIKTVILLLSFLIPLCLFFAAMLLSISIFAKSFKEAQSLMGPMNFIVIIPVLIGLLPGIKLNSTTALIPILNVSLATKEIIAGTIKTGLLIEVYLTLILIAGLGLYFCTQWFKREDVIFRGT